MAVPREVWISHEADLKTVSYEADGNADLVSTTNLTLSGVSSTIDGVAATAGMIVLAAGQTVASARGLYQVASGSWIRLNPSVAQTTLVASGTTYANTYWNYTDASTSWAPVNQIVREEIYAQNVTIQQKSEVKKTAQPGAAQKDTRTIPDGITITMTAYYERKSEQFTPFLDSKKRFKMRLHLINPTYNGNPVDKNENDDHVFRVCCVTDQKITVVDDKVIEAVLQLEAEYME